MQRGREWYHAIAGLNVEANPTIRFKMSKRDRPESDRPCVQIKSRNI